MMNDSEELVKIIQHKKPQGNYAFLDLLKICGKEKDIAEIERIQADLLNKGLHDKDIYTASSLISLDGKCGELGKAKEVFHHFVA